MASQPIDQVAQQDQGEGSSGGTINTAAPEVDPTGGKTFDVSSLL